MGLCAEKRHDCMVAATNRACKISKESPIIPKSLNSRNVTVNCARTRLLPDPIEVSVKMHTKNTVEDGERSYRKSVSWQACMFSTLRILYQIVES
eukprot:9362580-Pyramimonas_sp.AAC.2